MHQNEKPVSQKFFEKIRTRERIGLQKFDKFLSEDSVLLDTYKRQVEEASVTGLVFFCNFHFQERVELEKKIQELEEVEAFAKQRQKEYREAHQALETDSDTLVMTLGKNLLFCLTPRFFFLPNQYEHKIS